MVRTPKDFAHDLFEDLEAAEEDPHMTVNGIAEGYFREAMEEAYEDAAEQAGVNHKVKGKILSRKLAVLDDG